MTAQYKLHIAPHDVVIMDSSKLSAFLDSVYIPPQKSMPSVEVPNYHPCLIVQDKQTDTSKIKECGCADNYCVKNAPAWIPRAK